MTETLDINEFEKIGVENNFQDALSIMLESSNVLKDFNRKEIEQLVLYTHGYKIPKGVTLFQEGECDNHLIIITRGQASILKDDGMGKMKEIAIVRKGATLGEMTVIDGFPHSASVITTEDSEIALITKENLINITEQHPALGVKLLWQIAWQLSSRVRQASGQLVEYIN